MFFSTLAGPAGSTAEEAWHLSAPEQAFLAVLDTARPQKVLGVDNDRDDVGGAFGRFAELYGRYVNAAFSPTDDETALARKSVSLSRIQNLAPTAMGTVDSHKWMIVLHDLLVATDLRNAADRTRIELIQEIRPYVTFGEPAYVVWSRAYAHHLTTPAIVSAHLYPSKPCAEGPDANKAYAELKAHPNAAGAPDLVARAAPAGCD